MKKIIWFLMLMVLSAGCFAGKINRMVFFGDSLSDNGNLYKLFLHIIPQSPPYYQGRFSNGPTWAEEVGNYYYHKNYIDYKIYAVGGATAILHKPSTRFIAPTNLQLELDQYIIDNLFKDKSKTLHAIWIGGNDYLFDQDADANELTGKVVNKISWAVTKLIEQGAQDFLVMNLPDLSAIPFARSNGSIEKLHRLTELHNQKLDQAIKNLKAAYPGVRIHYVSVYDIFNDVIANPQKYNQKYKVNITNTAEACWQGDYLLAEGLANQGLESELQQASLMKAGNLAGRIDTQAMRQVILDSPSIAYTYSMGKAYKKGSLPCANADQYLFWDAIHPTETVHRVLAQIVVENLMI
ncbi:SGNH/GDSL hydrolase family protein [Aquicella lusitana]|uniref:Phospholipase/lecithinase/hemolysin n=1 Tax=Aquicella lusitana TaxID=254246 RepID=A0A370G7I9_9COXI|nr:SGNH/GDSL hydrolase family protein [Aquicella lusitana]RDI39046.1 phospholipase/lecithinase/hemolysin [Aquicella lusitana]VVC73653.1 Phosphatidylcholine-sterol acyltransferase [Aquicella lusitana]